MEDRIPFSQVDLNEIFNISPNAPDRVISRESSSLEFKESFGWASLAKYLKTSASYANAKGGYIVFGIANKPHRLVGLSGAKLKLFEEIDPERMSHNYNQHFAPEIKWDMREYVLHDKTFGLLYIHEAIDKPVLCTRSAGQELKEGDIYYRYRGRSERIKYSELRAILDSKRINEQRLWMKHLESIARIGVRDTGIFDLHTGLVTGAGGAFIIDESLLSQLTFIKEGEFSEIKGKPALKLIGQVEAFSATTAGIAKNKIVKTKGIRTGDIVLGFLSQENVSHPEEYIKQICFEATAFLPVYYFIKRSALSRNMVIEILEGVVARSPTRAKLIDRLKNEKTQALSIPNTSTESAARKRTFALGLRRKTVEDSVCEQDLVSCLQAMRGLTAKEVRGRSRYLRKLLGIWFNRHYASTEGAIADNLRRAICWLDEALHLEDCR